MNSQVNNGFCASAKFGKFRSKSEFFVLISILFVVQILVWYNGYNRQWGKGLIESWEGTPEPVVKGLLCKILFTRNLSKFWLMGGTHFSPEEKFQSFYYLGDLSWCILDPYDVRVVFLKIESFLFQSYCDVKLKFCLLDTRYRNKLSYNISRKYTIFLIDPYIKVAGLPEDRQTAKQMVLSVMDTKVGTINFNLSLRRNTKDLVLT